MRIDDEEVEVICAQCNGYLWSVGPGEDESGQSSVLINCPMQKDPLGRCTGNMKKAHP